MTKTLIGLVIAICAIIIHYILNEYSEMRPGNGFLIGFSLGCLCFYWHRRNAKQWI